MLPLFLVIAVVVLLSARSGGGVSVVIRSTISKPRPDMTPQSGANLSLVAVQAKGVRDPKLGRNRKPWGLCIHTTASGITDLAKKTGRKPIDIALDVYIASQNGANSYVDSKGVKHQYFFGGPSYVLEHDGTLHQIAPDNILTAHCGGPHRQTYLNGTWTGIVSPAMVQQWTSHWPGFSNPYHLFPSTDPNQDYVGIEVIQTGDGFGVPMRPGLWFTKAQHNKLIVLAKEMAVRHNWPANWVRTSRLLGHEDVDPIERSTGKIGKAHGYMGWDPGWLRTNPHFDFEYVKSGIEKGLT